MSLLIISDADVNAKSREGATPQDEALENRLMEIAEILIDNGAQVGSKNAKNILARIPLHAGIAKGYDNIVELLKSRGAIAPNGVMR